MMLAAGRLCQDAFAALRHGNVDFHNELILEQITRAAEECDIVVLAQEFMPKVLSRLPGELNSKVFTSPELGLKKMRAVLFS